MSVKILSIESGADVCSVVLSEDLKLIALKEVKGSKAHAAYLPSNIDALLKEHGLQVSDLDAIAINEGPGSYTGLRIGVSTAKGLCYASGCPMIAIGSLKAMAVNAMEQWAKNASSIGSASSTSVLDSSSTSISVLGSVVALASASTTGSDRRSEGGQDAHLAPLYICPMLDARRMEVYTTMFSVDLTTLEPVKAVVVDSDSFKEYLEKGRVLFCGNGALKTASVIAHPNALFMDDCISAVGMVPLALEAFHKKAFVDIAYFEPFYLKEFIALPSSKKLF